MTAGLEGIVQELPAAHGQRRAGTGQVAKAPDYAGAYGGSGQRRPTHEHWCSLVGIFGVCRLSYLHHLLYITGKRGIAIASSGKFCKVGHFA